MMIRKRVLAAVVVSIALFAWMDVLIWQRLIEARGLWADFDGRYHDGARVALAGIVIGGVILLWGGWAEMIFYPSTIGVLYHFGTADVLYYWLDGRAIPDTFRWACDAWHGCIGYGALDAHGIVVSVLLVCCLWGLLWFIALRYYPRLLSSLQFLPHASRNPRRHTNRRASSR